MPPINIDDTRPYQSLLLVRQRQFPRADAESRFVTEMETFLQIGVPQSGRLREGHAAGTHAASRVTYAYSYYVETKEPAWVMPGLTNVRDELNHIIVVCRYQAFLGVYFSDPGARISVLREIRKVDPGRLFPEIELVDRRTLARSFLGGKAKTLWLSGIHKSTATKADAKILSGEDLQRALDPLSDQSYHCSGFIHCTSGPSRRKTER